MFLMRQEYFLVAIFIAATTLRFGAVLALRDIDSPPGLSFGQDAIDFNELAQRVSNGLGYTWNSGKPTSFRAPGFPIVLAAIYWTCGVNYPAAYACFCAMGGLSCIFVYLMMREFESEQNSRLASMMAVVYLPHIYFATVFSSENVFVYSPRWVYGVLSDTSNPLPSRHSVPEVLHLAGQP